MECQPIAFNIHVLEVSGVYAMTERNRGRAMELLESTPQGDNVPYGVVLQWLYRVAVFLLNRYIIGD